MLPSKSLYQICLQDVTVHYSRFTQKFLLNLIPKSLLSRKLSSLILFSMIVSRSSITFQRNGFNAFNRYVPQLCNVYTGILPSVYIQPSSQVYSLETSLVRVWFSLNLQYYDYKIKRSQKYTILKSPRDTGMEGIHRFRYAVHSI